MHNCIPNLLFHTAWTVFSHQQCWFCKIWGYHTSANEDLSLHMPVYQFVVTDISEELAASHLQGQRSLRLKNWGSIAVKQIWTFTIVHQLTVTLSTSSLLIKILVKWETGWSLAQNQRNTLAELQPIQHFYVWKISIGALVQNVTQYLLWFMSIII